VSATLTLQRRIAERLKQEAEKQGASPEELIIETLLRDLDPVNRAKEYIEAADDLLDQAREEVRRGDFRQAAEKLWGAAALAVKAYASWRDGKRLTSHRELWIYSRKLVEELGEWSYDSWMAANGMHICFYEGWCSKEHVEIAAKRIEKLVQRIREALNA